MFKPGKRQRREQNKTSKQYKHNLLKEDRFFSDKKQFSFLVLESFFSTVYSNFSKR